MLFKFGFAVLCSLLAASHGVPLKGAVRLYNGKHGVNIALHQNATEESHNGLATATGMTKAVIGKRRFLHGVVNDTVIEFVKTQDHLVKIFAYEPILKPRAISMKPTSGLTCPLEQSGGKTSWGAIRTTQVVNQPKDPFHYDKDWGKDINLYVLDDGVDCSHSEFADISCRTHPDQDEPDVHGTACAAIAAGKQVGIAKSLNVISVPLLLSDRIPSLIKYIEWHVNDCEKAKKQGIKACISSNSWGFDHPENEVNLVNEAADATVEAGIHFVAAVDNRDVELIVDAPAGASLVIAVSNSRIEDERFLRSAWGKRVAIWAPGTDITTASPGDQWITASGTSFSTPLVAGVLATILHDEPDLEPAVVKSRLIETSLKGKIDMLGKEGSGDLAHISCTKQ